MMTWSSLPHVDEKEGATLGGSDREVKPFFSRELKGKPAATASREATLALRDIDGVIDIMESPSYIVSLFNEARTIKEKLTKTLRAADDALNMFFKGVDISPLKDYSGFGKLEIPKKDVLLELDGPSSSSKLVKQFPAPSMDPDRKKMIMFTILMDT